jgi:hypothetical protein
MHTLLPMPIWQDVYKFGFDREDCTDRRRLFAEQTVVAQLGVNSCCITKLVFGEVGT